MSTTTNTNTIPACDCHIHIYDLKKYPLAQANPYSPPSVTWEDYRRLQAQLGLERCIIVQPMGYGLDNQCTLDALAASNGSARAIIAAEPGMPTRQLRELDALGVAGVRFRLITGGSGTMTWGKLPAVAREIAALGWHINLQILGNELPEHMDVLSALPCPVVIDHIGKFPPITAFDDPAILCLRRLLDSGKFHVKLSAPYEDSLQGAPYDDVGGLASMLATEYTERCLWASNWPHPGQLTRPDDRQLLELLDQWAPSKAAKDKILRSNPQALYRFA